MNMKKLEAKKALSQGKAIAHEGWLETEQVQLVDGILVDEEGDLTDSSFFDQVDEEEDCWVLRQSSSPANELTNDFAPKVSNKEALPSVIASIDRKVDLGWAINFMGKPPGRSKKVSEKDREIICGLTDLGYVAKDVAAKLKVSTATIGKILKERKERVNSSVH
jgi:hypothetical protein